MHIIMKTEDKIKCINRVNFILYIVFMQYENTCFCYSITTCGYTWCLHGFGLVNFVFYVEYYIGSTL